MTKVIATTTLHQLFDLARQHRTHGVTVPPRLYADARSQLIALRDISESGVHPAPGVAEHARSCLRWTDAAALTPGLCHSLTFISRHLLREASLMLDGAGARAPHDRATRSRRPWP